MKKLHRLIVDQQHLSHEQNAANADYAARDPENETAVAFPVSPAGGRGDPRLGPGRQRPAQSARCTARACFPESRRRRCSGNSDLERHLEGLRRTGGLAAHDLRVHIKRVAGRADARSARSVRHDPARRQTPGDDGRSAGAERCSTATSSIGRPDTSRGGSSGKPATIPDGRSTWRFGSRCVGRRRRRNASRSRDFSCAKRQAWRKTVCPRRDSVRSSRCVV